MEHMILFSQLVAVSQHIGITLHRCTESTMWLGSKITVKFGLPLSTTAGDGPYHVGILGSRGAALPTTDSPTLATSAIVFTQCWFKEEK